jgi:hypothetical protein
MVKVHLLSDMTTWSKVNTGTLFYVMLGNEPCVGMKVEGKPERCELRRTEQAHGNPGN